MADTTELTAEDIDRLDPIYIGPTWAKDADGRFILPEHSLAWDILRWCRRYLHSMDGEGRWEFTKEQFRFLLWWYAVDNYGRFVYRRGVLQRLKGWGKDPLAAVMCLIEFLGPCQFSHFDEETGRPIGRPNRRAWVQIAAVNRDQTRNTMTLMPALISKLMIDTYGIKMGAELIRAHRGRCRLEAVTNSYRALEGGRSTFVIMNETHHWVRSNAGVQMYETVTGNTTKMNCRFLAITNAYLPGEDSVAEKMRLNYDLVQEGRAEDSKLLYDSIEAHEKTPLTEIALRVVIPKIRGDAVWLDVDAIMDQVNDLTISPARSRRMWLNQIVADKDAIYGPDHLKAIERRDAALKSGDQIVLGFDGGRYDDSTALVAIRVKDGTSFLLGLWEKPMTWDDEIHGRWQVDAQKVDSMVRFAFRTYDVQGMFADVREWESYIADWSDDYGDGLGVKSQQSSPIAFDMRSEKMATLAHEHLMSAILEAKVFYDGDLALKRHTMNARRHENQYGTYFRKESRDSLRKVDAYAAWVLAYEALFRLKTNPRELVKKKKTGAGYFL